jgi:uncharacterized protein YdhG (YjbR/CyaY superfamily)
MTFMKRPKSSKPHTTVDAYLAAVPQPQRATLRKLRAFIRAAAPRRATELISYGLPAFKYQQVLVWFAAFSDHCSFFPTARVIEQFRSQLKPYKISKGTIQFAIDKPLPASLIRKMLRARLAHIELKPKRKFVT